MKKLVVLVLAVFFPLSAAFAAAEIPRSVATPAFDALMSPKADAHSVIYVVASGDSFTKISRKNHVTSDLLLVVNGIDEKGLRPGMKLKIPTYKFSLWVDKAKNTVTLKGDEEILKTYIASTGANNSTPVGTFKITEKIINPTWYKNNKAIAPLSPENQLGTRWMGISKKSYGIHGTIDPDKLGQQVTAGCVRMKNEEVEELYRIVPNGTEVTIMDHAK